MKTKFIAVFVLLFFIIFFWFRSHHDGTKTPASPQVYVPEETFEFSPVVDGQEVRHDFAVLNKGESALDLMEVKPDCGCTTVSYPKRIPAGGEGKIAIELDTSGYSGQHISKTMVVRTNDKKKPEFSLVISGEVKPFARINPAEAKLTGNAGQEIKQMLTIASTNENPFKVLGTRAEKGDNIRYDLVEMNQPDGIKYQLTVYNLKQDKGWYIDNIYLQTNSKTSPVLKIPVFGIIRSGF